MSSQPRPPWTLRLTAGQRGLLDAVAAAMYGVFAWAVLAEHSSALFAPAGAALVAVPLVLQRRRLLTSFAIVLLACWLAPVVDAQGFLALPPLAFVLCRVAATHPARTAILVLGLALTGPVATAVPDFAHTGAIVPFALLLMTAWIGGLAFGQQRRYAEALHEHRLALAEAEADRARQAVADERLRIARDLHDVVAHSMSVITVQAAYGNLVFPDKPGEARAALSAVEVTGRQALLEMREMLGVLRDSGSERVARDAVVLSPAETLADLDRLVEAIARAGVRVELIVSGDARPLPAGIELSAYRIVQEALTNVVKHAQTDAAVVAISYGDDELSVAVTDAGAGRGIAQGAAPGHGLIGIRERAGLYGGSVRAGPLPERGYQVAVRLPFAGTVA